MSLILEALKKSEQQRRIGQVPTLGTPVFGTRRRRSLVPVIGLLLVAAGGIGAWLFFAPSRNAVSSAPEPARVESETAAPTPAVANIETGDTGTIEPESNKTGRAGPAPVRAPVTQAPAQPLSAYERERLKVTGALARSPSDRKPRPPVSRGVVPRQPPPATPAPGSSAPAVPAAAPPLPKPPTPAPPPSGVGATPAASAVPYLWELPFATRKELPPLQISMHVYAEDPEQRFAVIDGESYGEGDELGEGLVLKEIRPEGVVVDVAGKPFLLPAAGR